MTFKNIFKTALTGLQTNKSRAVLTILGIVIGITAVMLIASLGQGAQGIILSQIQSLGSKTIAVAPGREPKSPMDVGQIFSDSIKEKDVMELKKKTNVPHLADIMPILFGGETAYYQNESYGLTIFGASELFAKIYDITPREGFLFTDGDVKNAADAVIIGSKVKKELFGNNEAIGQKIKIKNKNFKVIGIIAPKGQSSFFNFDDIAVIPYTTAQQYIFGIKYYHRLVIQADAEENVDQTVRDIKTTLRNSHRITDPANDDFFVETQVDIMKTMSMVTDVFTLFLIIVAAISLVVGGIGIMNVMLISILERTREIGLRKALGATEKDILNQFLLEAVTMTGGGGLIGVALGASLSYLISFILSRFLAIGWDFTFPFFATFIGLSVSILIGLVFGIYPAKKAAQKSPIEALRYE